ncbi:ROK family protein [Jeotgalibacillus proteolyticus]|uniref:ROK family protein n=2 Tax=Jeotgalibacillus proteolyticus TaxID=2082395 RepID=A0A2S5GBT2_9BACL|nr:ROK family protein [Jeotgalibacillus proteolyticus]
MVMEREYLLAIDIGGTFIKLALVSPTGQLNGKSQVRTPDSLEQFCSIIDRYYELQKNQYNIIGVAISSPGSVTEAGDSLGYSSVPFVHEINLASMFSARYDLPVSIENDANCAALAELWNGEAVQLKTFACIVCGTGVGGAVVINKQLYKGANLHGGEFGYTILSSNLKESSYDTWSELGSSSAITRRLTQEPPYYTNWTGPKVFQQAGNDHDKALASLHTFFHTLAVGIHNIQYILDPEKILIGGGITRQPDFMNQVHSELNNIYAEKPFAKIRPSVSLCQHLDQAQLFGAAYVWLERYRKGERYV